MSIRFSDLVDESVRLLRERGRISYRALRLDHDLDEETLEALRAELVDVLEIAVELEGGVLEYVAPTEHVAADPAAERRRLTVLFCDLVGSTPLAEQLDPEDLRAVMRSYQSVTGDVIRRYGGHISQWIGDGVVVYYGYPNALEDDAFRAVQTGLEILEELKPITEEAKSHHDVDIQVRIGIHTGTVVVGDKGAGAQHETLAFGETPNIGARIEAAAEPGTVAISETTYHVVEGLFEFDDLGPHDLKGVSGPITLYRPTRTTSAVGRFDVVAAAGLTPIVDRDEARGMLRAMQQRVGEGGFAAGLITGEAGIGKSRLAHVAKQACRDAGWTIVDCRCSPFRQNSALFPIADGVQHWLQLDAAEDPFAALVDVVKGAEGLSVGEAAPLLADLLRIPYDPAEFQLAGIAPGRQRQITLEALTGLLRWAAAAGPTLVLIEDVHWVDPSTLEWVQSFIASELDDRILLLMTARPDFVNPFDSGVEVISLERLNPADTAQLVAHAAAGSDVTEELITQLAERADGVPLFVEELTKTVVETVAGEGEAGGEAVVPDSLYGALMARIDHLGDAKLVAQEASLIGREFSQGLLAAITKTPEALDTGLEDLVRAGLLYKRGSGGDATYTFKHALVQEVTAQSILRSVAQPYHGAIAESILERFPDLAAARPELVATHFTAAGRAGDAVPHWTNAGLAAIQKFAMAEAISYLGTAVELLKELPASEARDQMELVAQVLLAVPLTMTTGWASPEVGAAYERAHELVDETSNDPQLFPTLVGLFTYDLVSGQMERALETANANLRTAERIGSDELLLEAHVDAGNARFYTGDLPGGDEHLGKVLELYKPAEHHHHVYMFGKDPAAVAEVHLAISRWFQGFPDQALEISLNSVARTEEWLHPFSHVWALLGLAVVRRLRGELDEFRAVAERALGEAGEQGFPNWAAQAQVNLGWAMAQSGEPEKGIELIREGLALWEMTGAQLATTYFEYSLAEAHLAAGQHDLAIGVLESAVNRVEKTAERWFEAEIHRVRAEVLRAQGDEEGAAASFADAVEIAAAVGALSFELKALLGLSRMRASQDRFDEVRAELQAAYDQFTEGLDTRDLQEAAALLH